MEKWCWKCASKASPRPLFYFGKQPKKAISCKKFFLRIRYFERDYQKPVKRLTLFFLLNPLPVNGQSYKKQKRLGTSDQLLFRLWNKITKISLLITYSGSWVIPKITAANLCKPIHDIINYSIYICSFRSGKCGKEEKKLQHFDFLEN